MLRRGLEEGKPFTVLWALWLHRNEVIFQGRMTPMKSVVHDMEGFVSWWFRWERAREGNSSTVNLYFGGSLISNILLFEIKKKDNICAIFGQFFSI